MKQHLNTLYVMTQGSYLGREGESVVVRVEKQTRLRVPIHTIGSIVCFGRVGCSLGTMELCGQHGVSISHLNERGRFVGRVEGRTCGNVLLRREQYRRADDPIESAAVARAVVLGKVANSRAVLQRGLPFPRIGHGEPDAALLD
jgi:CRISPR-associated protein Cas1